MTVLNVIFLMFGVLKSEKLDVTLNIALYATHVTCFTLFPASPCPWLHIRLPIKGSPATYLEVYVM